MGMLVFGCTGFIADKAGRSLLASVASVAVSSAIDGRVEIGALEWRGLEGLGADVRWLDDEGQPVLEVPNLTIDTDLSGPSPSATVRADGFRVVATVRADGTIEPLDALPLRTLLDLPFGRLPDGWHADIELLDGEIETTAAGYTVVLQDVDIEAVADAEGGLRVRNTMVSARAPDLHGLALQARIPEVRWADHLLEVPDVSVTAGLTRATARVTWRDPLDGGPLALHVDVAEANLTDIAPLTDLPLRGSLAGTIDLELEGTHLGADVRLAGLGGTIGVEATGALAADSRPLTVTAAVAVQQLRVEEALAPVTDPLHVDLQAQLTTTVTDDAVAATGWVKGGKQDIAGLRFDRVDGEFALEGQTARLTWLEAEGIPGTIRASAEVDLMARRATIDAKAHLDLPGLAAIGAPPEIDGVADLEGRFEASQDEGIRGSGTLELGPTRYSTPVTIDGGRGTWTARIGEAGIAIEADATLLRAGAYGVGAQTVRVTSLRARRPWAAGVWVLGHARLGGLQVSDWISADSADATFRVQLEPNRRAIAQASIDLPPLHIGGWPGPGGTVDAALTGSEVTFEAHLDMLVASGTADLNTGQALVPDLTLRPVEGWTWKNTQPIALRLVEGGIDDVTLDLVAGEGELIAVNGTIGPRLDADMTLRGIALRTARELLPDVLADLPAVEGDVAFDGTITGDASAPVLTGTVRVDDAKIEGLTRPVDVEGTVRTDPGAGHADLGLSVDGEPVGTVTAIVPITLDPQGAGLVADGALEAQVDVRPPSLDTLLALVEPSLMPELVAELIEGEGWVEIRVAGTPLAPEATITGEVLGDVEGWRGPARATIGGAFTTERVDVRVDLAEDQRPVGSITVGGTTGVSDVLEWALADGPSPELDSLATWVGDMEVAVSLKDAPIPDISQALFDIPMEIRGQIDAEGGARVVGNVLTPYGTVSVHELSVGETSMGHIGAELVAGPTGYDASATLAFAPYPDANGTLLPSGLRIDASSPVVFDLHRDPVDWGHAPMSVVIGGPGVPIGALRALDPGIREGIGFVTVDGTVSGSPLHPEPDVILEGEGLSLEYVPFGLLVDEIQLVAVADADGVTVQEFTAHTWPTHPSVRGFQKRHAHGLEAELHVGLNGLLPGEVHGTVVLDHAIVSGKPERAVSVSTKTPLTVAGEFPELEIHGELLVERARVSLDQSMSIVELGLNTPAEQLDEIVTVVRTIEAPKARPVDREPLWAPFHVDVMIDLGHDTLGEVSMAYVDGEGAIGAAVSDINVHAELEGEIELSLVDGEPHVNGTLDVIEGTARLLGSRMSIDHGEVVFDGQELMNPAFDVFAAMPVTDARIDVAITGTLEDPNVHLLSDDFPNSDMMLAAILTGENPEYMDSAEQATAMGAAVSGAFINAALESTDVVDMEMTDGMLQVSSPISRHFVLTAGATPIYQPWENRVLAELAYHPRPHAHWQLVVGDFRRSLRYGWRTRF